MEKNIICLSDLLQGGTTCKNPTITWTKSGETCLLINCIDNNCVTVQVPEDCEEQCVTFIINCDDCDQCPQHTITRCLCDDNGGCPNCFDCVDGFCAPIPCPDQICDPDTGDCVDCIDDTNCPCNQICLNNTCQCEDPSQYVNSKGCCVDCLTSDQCPECHLCIGGECVPVDCPDGICDPDTDLCVECLVAGDCSGENECCVGNRCVCCPGYYRDQNGDCVEIPDCNSDDDCPACFICIDGECQPLQCPPGKVCVDGDCVDECDCFNPQCTGGRQCVSHYTGVCYCKECEGACDDDNDCGEGCECVNGNCQNKPCFGPCINGGDCGPGCGCVNGNCAPCSNYTCEQCDAINGCDCIGGVCVDSPCDAPCVDGRDCDPGCGCLDNNCVACQSRTCETNPDCPEGCFCDDGVCNENPCAEVFCSNPNDCGQGCGCDDGICVPCSSLSCEGLECFSVPGCECNESGDCVDDNGGCEDEFTITKINNGCDVRVDLTTQACCQCDDIQARFEVEYVLDDQVSIYNATIDLYKNGVPLGTAPNLNPEDLPISGTIRARLIQNFREVNAQGNFIPGGATLQLTTTKSTPNNIVGLDTLLISFTDSDPNPIPAPGVTVTISGKNYRIASRQIYVDSTANLAIVNECNYTLSSSLVYNRQSYSPPPVSGSTTNTNKFLTRNVLCRLPLINFYKSTTAVGLNDDANIIDRTYAARISATQYRVTYTDYPEIEYGRYFRASTACGCKNNTVYSCYGTSVATPLVFCDPSGTLMYDISDCGKKLTFLEDVEIICDVYLAVGANKPQYGLYINGALKATRTLGTAPATGTVIFAAAEEFTHGSCITSVELRFIGDVCDDCKITQNEACNEVFVTIDSITAPCDDLTDVTVLFTISGGTAPYSYEIRRGSTVIDSDTGVSAGQQVYNGPLPALSGVITVEVEDDAECVAVATLPYNLTTGTLSGSNIAISGNCNNDSPKISITNTSGGSVTVTYTQGATTIGPILVTNGASNTTILPSGGIWAAAVASVSDPTCVYNTAVDIDCCVPNPFATTTFTYNQNTCLYQVTNLPSGAQLLLNGDPLVINDCLANGTYTVEGVLGNCIKTITVFEVILV